MARQNEEIPYVLDDMSDTNQDTSLEFIPLVKVIGPKGDILQVYEDNAYFYKPFPSQEQAPKKEIKSEKAEFKINLNLRELEEHFIKVYDVIRQGIKRNMLSSLQYSKQSKQASTSVFGNADEQLEE